jgi:hypothetical protein
VTLAYKFTDTDVRTYPGLVGEAYAFLHQYQGEFDFLRDAKQELAERGGLPTGVVRGVLNCMRTQPNAAQILSGSPQRPNLRIVREPERVRMPFWLKTTWHYEYLVPIWPFATKAHLLDPVRSGIKYWPSRNEFQMLLKPYCGARLSTGMCMDNTKEREVCVRCIRAREDRQRSTQ